MKYHILSIWVSLLIINYLGINTFKELPTKLFKPIPFCTGIWDTVQWELNVSAIRVWSNQLWNTHHLVWDSHTTTNINKLESIQKAAARFCFNDFSRLSSVTAMLTSLDLQSRRMRAKLITMHKIINDLVSIPKDYFISPNRLRRGYYKQLFTGIDSYEFSFIPSVIKLWNSLSLI